MPAPARGRAGRRAAAPRPGRRRPARPGRPRRGRCPGFYERTAGRRLGAVPAVRACCPRSTGRTPNLRFVDLDGDGHADILITEDERRSPGTRRWRRTASGRPSTVPHRRRRGAGPRLVFADGTQSHLPRRHVRRRPHRPRAHPQRRGLLLAEPRLRPVRRQGHDGRRAVVRPPRPVRPAARPAGRHRRLGHRPTSSTSAADGVRLYFNQSGNGWATPRRARPGSRASTTVVAVTTADLLGNGTACLVWSSPLPPTRAGPLRYVDLMGGTKPHLLHRGGQQPRRRDARSTTRRRPGSTWPTGARPAVGDPAAVPGARRRAGRDLRPDQPQPVRHPLRLPPRLLRRRRARVPRLRHGRAVGHRGVRRARRRRRSARCRNVDAASHVPPVLTRTWFHTGAYVDREPGAATSREYWSDPASTTASRR